MNLQTQIPIKKQTKNLIDYHSKIFLVGSCFSKNIGNKLSYYKFQSFQNPFGILFHPKSLEDLFTNAIEKKIYTENDFIFQNERWHSFEAHSILSSADKNEILKTLNSLILQTNKQINESTHIIITLGTSWVYRFIQTGKIVANCHKISQKKFLKELLSVDEITRSLNKIISLIKGVNKRVKIIFTISPVRHLKDGFIENTQSKSHLITGLHKIENKTDTAYFPSYEIMMDQLRDYRFYKQDMIHPNKTAIDYIWERFLETWLSDNAKVTLQKVESIQKGISHKPFNVNSCQHQQFLKNLSLREEKLQSQFPFIKF